MLHRHYLARWVCGESYNVFISSSLKRYLVSEDVLLMFSLYVYMYSQKSAEGRGQKAILCWTILRNCNAGGGAFAYHIHFIYVCWGNQVNLEKCAKNVHSFVVLISSMFEVSGNSSFII